MIQNSYFKLSNLHKAAAIVIILTKTEDVEGSEFCQPTYATIPFKYIQEWNSTNIVVTCKIPGCLWRPAFTFICG